MPETENNLVEPTDDSLEAPAGPPAPQVSSPPPMPPKKDGLMKRFRAHTNIYLVVFLLLLLVTGLIIYITVKGSQPKTNVTSAGSLTDQQLAALKGNTTLIGDAKQTLDVQSNAIFEGQVLLRSDLNVAGTIKVGGGLSLSSLTIGGPGNVGGQLAVNGGLNVGGDTILQGSLTVQKNLSVGGSASFGSLSVSTLNVTNLSLKSDLSLSRHITTSGGAPSRANGSALGAGGTASVNGSDTAGTVNINTGGGPPAGCFVTVNFNQRFGSTPHVVISPASSAAGSLQYYVNRTSSGFSICTANAPSGGTSYVFDYVVVD
jgi:hypothetical protein